MDKMRKVMPLSVTFGSGEQPSSAKINAISEQARNGLGLIENAIGDLWNQSGDSIFTSYPTLIPNLARLIGENKYLNPALYNMNDKVSGDNGLFTYTEFVGTKYIGLNEFHLLFKPRHGNPTTDISANGLGSLEITPKNYSYDVVNTNDWWVDISTGPTKLTGKVIAFTPLVGTEKISYIIDTADWPVDNSILPGIIPDPRQDKFMSCRVSQPIAGIFYLHLPPRQPLTNMILNERPATYPADEDLTDNKDAACVNTSARKFWQSDAVDAFTAAGAAWYRYAFPQEIQDAISGGDLVAGDEIPAGVFLLYDQTSRTIIEDCIFKVITGTNGSEYYILEIESESFDFTTVDKASDTEDDYSGTDLTLITCGAPVARSIWSLMSLFLKHSHNRNNLEATVSHNNLDDLNPPTSSYTGGEGTGHDSRYPTGLPTWAVSHWSNDPHTSLLSRAGSQTSSSRYRDQYNNAMLGHLLIANANSSDYLNGLCPSNSYSIYFGNTDGPRVYAMANTGSTGNRLRFYQTQVNATNDNYTAIYGYAGNAGVGTNAHGVYGGAYGASGYGVYGYSQATSGYGVYGRSKNDYGVYGVAGLDNDSKWIEVNSKYGVYGHGSDHVSSTNTHGVVGTGGTNSYGVFGTGNGTGHGVRGQSTATGSGGYFTASNNYATYSKATGNYAGIYGWSTGTGSTAYGGYFISGSNAHGVKGVATGATTAGVYGDNSNGYGVWGNSTDNVGVYGVSSTDHGVRGQSTSGTGCKGVSTSSKGICGLTDGLTSASLVDACGVFGEGTTNVGVYGVSSTDHGIYGSTSAVSVAGLYGVNDNASGYGVWGVSNSGWGVYGWSSGGIGVKGISSTGVGLEGYSNSAPGIWGASNSNHGIYGTSAAAGQHGIYGSNTITTATGGAGVYGYSASGHGVVAESGEEWDGASAFRIVPQSDTPPGTEGDIMVSSVDHKLWIYLDGQWRTVDVTPAV